MLLFFGDLFFFVCKESRCGMPYSAIVIYSVCNCMYLHTIVICSWLACIVPYLTSQLICWPIGCRIHKHWVLTLPAQGIEPWRISWCKSRRTSDGPLRDRGWKDHSFPPLSTSRPKDNPSYHRKHPNKQTVKQALSG